ncbi:ABC transporter permease [Candidatus Peregrinibacteria bacterium]|nr:ABC transporter permease [Candidatus Peregrinibacteria bacterium]
MRLHDTFITALTGVRTHASRSLLTMLGIVIGVAAVVLMSCVGESMKGVILGQISSLGPKSMVIFPGQQEGGPSSIATGHDSLTFEDLDLLKKLPTITHLAPVIFLPGTVSYGREEGSPQVFGVMEEFFSNQNIVPSEGRLIDNDDIDGARPVALIAPDVRTKFFGSGDPVGRRIRIGGNHFTVIGVTKALGSQFFQNADDRVYVPFSVAKNISGQKYLNYITMEAVFSFDLAFDDVKNLLRLRHGISPSSSADSSGQATWDETKDDFVVRSSAQANEILSAVSLGLTAFITTVAAISLLVGGIGIMNIMLVSVTERTAEIGLRKAVGAHYRDILLQFLIEAVLLTFIGGVVGLFIGIALAFGAAQIVQGILSTYIFAVSLPAVLAALLMAALTGLAFGLQPARRAAKLSPIEALRYE